MSGRAGARGYLLQSLVCLLDSLDSTNNWTQVTIEPLNDSEKVDILWEYPGRRKVVQVKSSQNQFGLAAVTAWAKELETSTAANEYELRLIGTCSYDVARIGSFGAVSIPLPEAENIPAFLERAAHKLDHHLSALTPPVRLTPSIRELVVAAMAQRLAAYSTHGGALSRAQFIETVSKWISEIRQTASTLHHHNVTLSRNHFFVARGDILAAIERNFAPTSNERPVPLQVLAGLGGVGKTQIAIEYAHRASAQYHSTFFVDASTEATLTEGFASIADTLALKQPADTRRTAAENAITWLHSNLGWLLLLDNADSPALATPYLTSLSSGHTLLTSRASVFDMLGVVTPLVVSPLNNEEAYTFLTRRTGKTPDTENESKALWEICHALDGLPLALEQAGAYILSRNASFENYLKAWRAKRLQLIEQVRPVTGGYDKTVGTTWLLNFDAVRDTSKAAFDVLAISAFMYRSSIPLDFIAASSRYLGPAISSALADFDPETNFLPLDELIYPLTSFSLIEKDSDDVSFSIHPLVQDALRNTIETSDASTWRRLLIIAFAKMLPDVDFETWWLSERLHRHAISVVSGATENELLMEEAGTVLHRCAQYIEETGDYKFAASIYIKAIKIRQKVLPTTHPDLGATLNNLGVTIQRMGYYKEAEEAYRKALRVRLAARGAEHRDVAQTWNNLGLVLVELGRYPEAESFFRKAMPILEAAGEQETTTLAICKSNLAALLELRGQHDQSDTQFHEALQLQRDSLGEDHPRVIHTLKVLVNRLDSRGQHDQALELLRDVMTRESRVIGESHPDFSRSLLLLGNLLVDRGDVGGALAAYQAASSAIVIRHGQRHYEMGAVYNNLASLHMREGDVGPAITKYRLAIDIYSGSVGPDTGCVGATYINLGHCYIFERNSREASKCFEEGLRIYKRIHGRLHNKVGMALGNLAFVAAKSGEHDRASQLFAEAFAIYENLGFPNHKDCVGFVENYIQWLRHTCQSHRVPRLVALLIEIGLKPMAPLP